MAKQIRQVGRALLYILPLVVLAVIFVLPQQPSEAAYSNPYWTNDSSSPECPCSNCGCGGAPEWYPEGDGFYVNVRTRELMWQLDLLRMPGLESDFALGLLYRTAVNGETDFGSRMLLRPVRTAQKVILDAEHPNDPGGHEMVIRDHSGLPWIYSWDGSVYSAESCKLHDELTVDQSGDYILTDPWKNYWTFDATTGMPKSRTSANANVVTYTFNEYLQLVQIEDDRGGIYTFYHDENGYISQLTDPAEREWGFAYSNGLLVTITLPATPDQEYGSEITLGYDEYDRLCSLEDGREHTVMEIDYTSSTYSAATITRDGNDIDWADGVGFVSRVDALGTVQRFHSTGRTVTQHDFYIDSQAEYVRSYRYNGDTMINMVNPEGDRIDYTRDGSDNLTEERHRTTDTDTNDSSDLVRTWTYGSPVPLTYTDPEGNEWSYGYDGAYNRTSVTHPTVTEPSSQSASTSTTYNGKGQIATYTNEEGLLTTYVYYSSGASKGLLEKIQVGDPGFLLETSFTYDDMGNVATKTDPEGNTWTYTWDDRRRLKESQAPSPLGYKVKYEYDANGNLVKKEVENRDKDGESVTGNPWFTTTYTYTNLNQVATITEEIDASTTRTTSIYYDENGQRTRVVKPEGNEDRWTYDERGLVLTHTRGYGSVEASTSEFAYDDNGRLVTETNGRDYDTDHDYDAFGRRTKTTNALGHYTTWTYDKNGNVTEVARYASGDTLMQRSTRYFDERGRQWKTSDLRKDPSQTYSDAVTTITRLKTGQVASVTDARSNTTTYDFDDWLRVDTVTDAEGNETTLTRDDNGNVLAWSIEETDGASTVTHEYEATFDALNRRLTTVEIDRTDSENTYTTTAAYDSRSNRVWMVNAEGNPTRWTFDGLGRMVMRERALTIGTGIEDFQTAQVTEWGFDDNDRLVSHIDDGENESTWAYDDLDRPTTMTYPDESSASYEYDDADNIVEVTDPAGNVITDTFDALNRNTARSISLDEDFAGTTAESRTYDALNRLLTAQDNDYKVTFTYAVTGMASHAYTETQEYVGGSALAKTVTKTYDAVGNKVTETYPSTLALGYTYSDINLLEQINDGTNAIVDYTYWGTRLKGATFENGTTQSNTYGGFRQDLTSVHHETSSPATIVRMDYGYNAVHDRTYERFGASGSTGDAFEYDKLRRLTNAWMGSATPSDPSSAAYTKKIDYNMDDDGNRDSVVVTPYQQQATSTSYTTNDLNQYTNVGGTTHVWDANGNLVDDGTLLFEYDYKNLPVYVRLKSNEQLIVTYKYDALGRRVEKDLGSNNEQRYIYSGLETIATYNAFDTWKQDFVYAQGIDQIVMLEQADVLDYDSDQDTSEATRSYYHRNALGSVMEITDANEATVVSYRYDPYGTTTITRGGQTQSTDPLGQHWTFTARFLDEETGCYYFRARYYNPSIGVFGTRDPLGLAASSSLYEYCWSAPTACRDSLGLHPSVVMRSGAIGEGKATYEAIGPDPHGSQRVRATYEFSLEENVVAAFKCNCGGGVTLVPGQEERDAGTEPTARGGCRDRVSDAMCIKYTLVLRLRHTQKYSVIWVAAHSSRTGHDFTFGDGVSVVVNTFLVFTGNPLFVATSVGWPLVDPGSVPGQGAMRRLVQTGWWPDEYQYLGETTEVARVYSFSSKEYKCEDLADVYAGTAKDCEELRQRKVPSSFSASSPGTPASDTGPGTDLGPMFPPPGGGHPGVSVD